MLNRKPDDKPGYVLDDHLSWTGVAACLTRPTESRRAALCLSSVLLRMGFTCALAVTDEAVGSYSTLPTLPSPKERAVYFCCTGLGVTSTGRYPASCPMKPGLSSATPFRDLQPRSPVRLSLLFYCIITENATNSFCCISLHSICSGKQHAPDRSERKPAPVPARSK